jgi:hypothetical protein
MKNIRLVGLLFGLALPLGAAAAEPACLSTAVAAKEDAAKGLSAASREQIERSCRTVAIEPKAGGNPSMWRVIQIAYAPKVVGGDRLKPAAPMGMPTGAVMPRAGQIELDASELAAEGLLSLEVSGPQVRLSARPVPANGIVALDAAQLRQGVDYRWVLATRRQQYEGTFTLPDAETLQRTQARVQKLAGAGADRGPALLLEAAIYDEEELFATRDLVIVAYRREFK